MRKVLILESSTEHGSIAVVIDGRVAADVAFAARDHVTGERTESLAPSVSRAMTDAGIRPHELSAVVCSGGPGGFTSLRAAAAVAKGICFAVGVPLYSVSSLAVLAWSAVPYAGSYVAAIAAGRNEWFAAPFAVSSDGVVAIGPECISADAALRSAAVRDGARLVGDGLEVQAVPRAAAIAAHLALIETTGEVDLDAWEPAYGRLAEAQVKWEAAHGRPLSA